jgi:hypothetical protein
MKNNDCMEEKEVSRRLQGKFSGSTAARQPVARLPQSLPPAKRYGHRWRETSIWLSLTLGERHHQACEDDQENQQEASHSHHPLTGGSNVS